MEKTVIFDYDGTSVDTMETIFKGACNVFRRHGLKLPTYEEYVLDFGFPYIDFYRKRGVEYSDDEIWSIFSETEFPPIDSFYKDSLPTFSWLKENDYTPAILTANPSKRVLETFESVGLGEIRCVSTRDKPKAIAGFVRNSPRGWTPPCFGDICDDIRAAVKGGAFGIAVLRGELRRLAPDFFEIGASACIGSLSEVEVVLRQLSYYNHS